MPSKPRGKVGRPPLARTERRGARIVSMVTDVEKGLVAAHCEREGITESDLVRARLADILGLAPTAPSILIPRVALPHVRPPGAHEESCAVCSKPVKLKGHRLWLWVHMGGNHAVTRAEGERLNREGHDGSDLGRQPIGRDCLKNHPELKPYVGDVDGAS